MLISDNQEGAGFFSKSTELSKTGRTRLILHFSIERKTSFTQYFSKSLSLTNRFKKEFLNEMSLSYMKMQIIL